MPGKRIAKDAAPYPINKINPTTYICRVGVNDPLIVVIERDTIGRAVGS